MNPTKWKCSTSFFFPCCTCASTRQHTKIPKTNQKPSHFSSLYHLSYIRNEHIHFYLSFQVFFLFFFFFKREFPGVPEITKFAINSASKKIEENKNTETKIHRKTANDEMTSRFLKKELTDYVFVNFFSLCSTYILDMIDQISLGINFVI